jgi:cobalamin biosynthesis Mg chelatase CobN
MSIRAHMRTLLGILLTRFFVAAFVAAGPASARGCGSGVKHHGNPSVSQYIEKIPTACGSKSDRGSSAGGATSNSSPLPPAVSNQLNRSTQGKLLKQVSSSNRLGAPSAPVRPTHPPDRSTSGRSALSASVSAVSSGSNGGLIALLVVMAVLALAVAGAAVYRRRPTR